MQTHGPRTRLSSGFTIVELLIVIVVIAILAAITIVAFNGVTARANTSSAEAAASTVAKKAEAYNAEQSSYPASSDALTNPSDAAKPWYVTGATFSLYDEAGPEGSVPSSPSSLDYSPCPNDPPYTGAYISYFDYTESDTETITVGTCPSGSGDV